jgi:hypothetical protein
MPRFPTILCAAVSAAAFLPGPAAAATPRETLTQAAFAARDKPAALARIAEAEAAVNAVLARQPRDREANLLAAMAIGYRAKLNKGRSEAVEAGRRFAALAAANPADPEAQAALGAWHLDAVTTLGGMMAGVALGAKKAAGLAAMDRAVACDVSRPVGADAAGARSGRPEGGAPGRSRGEGHDAHRTRRDHAACGGGGAGAAARREQQTGSGTGPAVVAVRPDRRLTGRQPVRGM